MWGYCSDYKAFPSQYTTAIHQPWLTPLCYLFPAPLPCPASSELLSPPHFSAQPPLVHPLFLATEIPFFTTKHPLLFCCLMRLSTHLSVLSYKLLVLWPCHVPEEQAEGGHSHLHSYYTFGPALHELRAMKQGFNLKQHLLPTPWYPAPL